MATSTAYKHAALWFGAAASATDLNPSGWDSSVAFATSGKWRAGTAPDTALPPKNHSIVWSGTAASALGIDEAGNVVGTMTSTSPTGVVTQHAVLWARAQ